MRYTNYMDDNDMDVTNSRVTFVSRGCHVGFTSWAHFSAKTDARAHYDYMYGRTLYVHTLYTHHHTIVCGYVHAHVYIMRIGAPMRT